MTTQSAPRHGSVVVGVDGSPESEHAVLWAAEEACHEHRRLTLVHTEKTVSANELAWLAQAGIPPRQVEDEIRVDAERIMQRARSLAADRYPEAPIETVIGYGDARKQLLELAAGASMVVVGTRGHGTVAALLLGSVSAALVRHSPAPVAVVRANPTPTTRGVVIAADGSEASLDPIEQAFREASERHLPLTIAHCLWDGLMAQVRWAPVADNDPVGDDARVRIAESVAGMGEKYPDVSVEVLLARGAIDAFLVDVSSDFDLLVLGRPPRSLGQRLTLSGLTTSIAEHARSTVLVVP